MLSSEDKASTRMYNIMSVGSSYSLKKKEGIIDTTTYMVVLC